MDPRIQPTAHQEDQARQEEEQTYEVEHTSGAEGETHVEQHTGWEEERLRNEALRRRELLSCRQYEGESFEDFYVRLRRIAEEVDVCPGNSSTCHETQMKMIILMGIRDDELVQRLISLDSTAYLADVVTICRSYEAAKCATSAIRAPQDQLRAVSAYKKGKKNKGHEKNLATKPSPTIATFCKCCAKQHGPNACPATQSTCTSCGRQGHWARTVQCPANQAQCRFCGHVGHYDKCCRTKKKDGRQSGFSSNNSVPNNNNNNNKHQDTRINSCRHLGSAASSATKTPQPINVLVSYGEATSHLLMLPDTGADVTVIGKRHLEILGIPLSSLQPPACTTTLTADGSTMAPALGIFKATLNLGKRSCPARIQVHEGVQTPLLSYGHCKELAIISSDFPKPILEVKHVRLPSGRVWWRNRRFLRPVPDGSDDPLSHSPVAPCLDHERGSNINDPPVFPRRSQRLKEKESARD
ncbi:hypothetical protein Pmani_018151 [Petrolisthes manimaculis]|uniref:Peptidase A2 domain-containing protein n=1 Tax=Petrolisthes manimaculis TaxID=1843537 RepID=A0AAE1PNA8_9EUCA|nr:hypothetical protein Pmani_018151 [Petrolisthes manimaculis]